MGCDCKSALQRVFEDEYDEGDESSSGDGSFLGHGSYDKMEGETYMDDIDDEVMADILDDMVNDYADYPNLLTNATMSESSFPTLRIEQFKSDPCSSNLCFGLDDISEERAGKGNCGNSIDQRHSPTESSGTANYYRPPPPSY